VTESIPKRWDSVGGGVFSGQSYIVIGCFPDQVALWDYGFRKNSWCGRMSSAYSDIGRYYLTKVKLRQDIFRIK